MLNPHLTTHLPAAATVRLSQNELEALAEVFDQYLGDDLSAQVYLFGSRCDLSERGGDLDLLISSPVAAMRRYESRKRIQLAIREGWARKR